MKNLINFTPNITGDQPWHGTAIESRGVGYYAGPLGTVTAETLAPLIVKATTNTEVQTRAQAMGEKMRKEDGVKDTIDFMDLACSSFPYPWSISNTGHKANYLLWGKKEKGSERGWLSWLNPFTCITSDDAQ